MDARKKARNREVTRQERLEGPLNAATLAIFGGGS